jgi:NTE family protein
MPLTITPDADSRAAMGTNQMDPANRIPAARAGFAQGKQEAARMRFLRRLHADARR